MNTPSASRPHLFGVLAGLALAAGLVFAALVFANAWTRIAESQVINVTGSARKNIRSDLIVWRASFSADAPTLLEAQQKLRADSAKVAAFLAARGIDGFTASAVQIRELTAKQRNAEDDTVTNVRVGYRLSQSIEVHSPEGRAQPRRADCDAGRPHDQGAAQRQDGCRPDQPALLVGDKLGGQQRYDVARQNHHGHHRGDVRNAVTPQR